MERFDPGAAPARLREFVSDVASVYELMVEGGTGGEPHFRRQVEEGTGVDKAWGYYHLACVARLRGEDAAAGRLYEEGRAYRPSLRLPPP